MTQDQGRSRSSEWEYMSPFFLGGITMGHLLSKEWKLDPLLSVSKKWMPQADSGSLKQR